MQFTTTKISLVNAVNTVQKAVSTKTTLPILEGILFEAIDNDIYLMGTDMEIGIRTKLSGNVYREGKVVLSAKLISELSRKLPDDEVKIELKENNKTLISCKNSEFNIQGEAGEDFPKMPEVVGEKNALIPKELFRSLIKETIFSVAKSDNIPILTGELLEISDGEFKIVALDGYRLALRKAKTEPDIEIKEVIPERTMMEIYRLLSMKEEDVYLSATKNQVLFTIGETSMVSNLLQGEYINYKQIIPSNSTTKIKVNTQELLSSCERAALMVRDGKNNLIKMNFSDSVLEILSNSDLGNLHESIDVDMTGDPLKIAFNCNYFIDALKAVSEEEINLEFTTSVSPCVIKPVDGDYFTYLILPVRYIEH
ncbi:DNA polymerase III subunit beta [Alkalibacter saccharofermentans]|uniref:Beta sliding clamp n=1 Tax=Alkalibacter saccharofermentans DSM 14828 TaxID=1120975 RepID=A0A1M4T6G6_9FIRM|nr:DNA polymerase III subunit beta [Alkalibacter saccharofermentans]SHE40035.1 DNA polymerase III, beta subunit [Alkalibacter saccharofermentans DSM 14828]